MNLHDAVVGHLLASGYWKVLPEVSWCDWFADFIAWGTKPGVLEVEVKHTWSDYQNDHAKASEQRQRKFTHACFWADDAKFRHGNSRVASAIRRLPQRTKYETIWHGPAKWRPTHFVYAAPVELAKRIAADPARPKQFGVWGFHFTPAEGTSPDNWRFSSSVAPMRRIRTMTAEEFKQFERQAGVRALMVLRDLYRNEHLRANP